MESMLNTLLFWTSQTYDIEIYKWDQMSWILYHEGTHTYIELYWEQISLQFISINMEM